METLEQITIGEYVAKDFRTAALFSKYGIDFCCNGNRSIEEACQKKAVTADILLQEIETVLSSKSDSGIDYNAWPIDLLADYIEKTHHRYVSEKTPVLLQFLDKLSRVHGAKHPELLLINELFKGCAGELAQHMKKEELILFPFIKKLVHATLSDELIELPHFETIQNPIAMMMHEHDAEGVRFRKIAELSNNYTPPADGCNTYKVTFAMLEEFEQDLHKHIHLENNILFPKAAKLEKDFTAQ
ncbi:MULTISPECIES: iron-sulfur cluster repair di-iron protein [Flavobacterium]|jgi:regulator of cell morphogenesis and NO signaling|uniref:Regulator of cell morphogenesis and NO signaling n=3 Tax=Flavobacterium TaxID=237 RepID=A0A7W7N6W5_9FLAO|nr:MULTISPECIES: iron-sulfur cluster repair di-iron protein [Flavobacterium]NWL03532.1 iron-sulfur cluster repair di-iron protein [Flavobacterium collinsii]MBB4802083.1 regulator of cell morphogenesis and NO signaling [Flavobacterium nitrogenifigens]MBB6387041.1 regulator of cell morphogenesis and NO signaling [Flavobacterium notoginsengisoli]MBW1656143.1 iron-sulfur cluster repair di-iron protein [Flavobacterium quisquiliarum]WET02904.1 iron-sulfur cluster repair di-iron protein [Flavobacteri